MNMNKFKLTLLTASLALAMAFTFSCSSDDGDGDGDGNSSSSIGNEGTGTSSSSRGEGTSSSSGTVGPMGNSSSSRATTSSSSGGGGGEVISACDYGTYGFCMEFLTQDITFCGGVTKSKCPSGALFGLECADKDVNVHFYLPEYAGTTCENFFEEDDTCYDLDGNVIDCDSGWVGDEVYCKIEEDNFCEVVYREDCIALEGEIVDSCNGAPSF
jgi:hypothetical protein